MNNRLFFLLGILVLPLHLFSADEESRIRQLDLTGSTYNPGGEPAPVMLWVPKEEVNAKIKNPVSRHIRFVLLSGFFPKPTQSIKRAVRRYNDLTAACYDEENLEKVAFGRDDMQKLLDSLKKPANQ